MSWTDGPMIGLDLETDSPDPEDAHLVTAAIVHHVPGEEARRYRWVAQARRPIPDQAAAIHGYTTERAHAEGRPATQVVLEIAETLERHWSPECPLVAVNSPFDLTVVDRELARLCAGTGLEIDGLPVIDTYLIDKRTDKWREGSRRLADTCRHYGIELVNAHDSMADVSAALRLAWRQAKRHRATSQAPGQATVGLEPGPWPVGRYGPSPEETEAREVLARGDVMELHAAERRWFREEARGLAAYFRAPRPSKATDKIERDCAAGITTREQADELLRTLDARADDVELHADGWPMRARDYATHASG